MDPEASSSLLTVAEVAARLRVRPSTVYAAVAKHRLPHVKLWQGNRRALIRFRERDIQAFLDARSVRDA